jgi:hypothetical protein
MITKSRSHELLVEFRFLMEYWTEVTVVSGCCPEANVPVLYVNVSKTAANFIKASRLRVKSSKAKQFFCNTIMKAAFYEFFCHILSIRSTSPFLPTLKERGLHKDTNASGESIPGHHL